MRLSKIISVFLHPIFMPIIALYVSLKLIPNIGFSITAYLNFIYLTLLICTIILPLISMLFLIKKKLISSLEMSSHQERSIPLLITSIYMAYAYYNLAEILVLAPVLKAELFGGIIILVVASIISKYWKISLHMLGVGGFFGVIFSLNTLFGGLTQAIILSILFSGILGVARINEKAHNRLQIYIGFIIGFLIEVISILFF